MKDRALKVMQEIQRKEQDELVDDLNRDLYSLILEKAEGDVVYKKVQGVKTDQGIRGYAVLYRWYTEISGMGLAEQARRRRPPRGRRTWHRQSRSGS